MFHPLLALVMAAAPAMGVEDPFAAPEPPPSKKAVDLKVCPRGHEALKDLPQGGCCSDWRHH